MNARSRALCVALAVAGSPILAALIASVASARPGSPIKLDRFVIEAKAKLTDVIIEDLDGDGRKDLMLILGREVRVFFQRPNGSFATDPDQSFRLDPRASIFDLGDVSGTKRKDFVFIREDGVFAYVLTPPESSKDMPFYELRPKKLIAAPTILRRPGEDEARRKEFLRDVDGDGKLDVIVPERSGFGIYRGLGEWKFEARQPLPAPPVSVVDLGSDHVSSRISASYYFANPFVADFDACGKPEIVLVQESALQVWKVKDGRLGGSPTFETEVPGVKTFSFDAERPFELDFTMPIVLRDLDHDGRVDAALTHVGTGTTRIFLNGPDPEAAFKSPAHVVRAKGVTFLAFFVDLDGDGRDDMVLPRMDKLGIWSILKAVVTRSVPVEAQFFYQRKQGSSFPEEPDFRRNVEIPLAFHVKGEGFDVGTAIIVSLDGDFDGDGLKDLVFRTDSTTLSIFPGLPDHRGIGESASAQLEIPTTDDARFVLPQIDDLNGDGRADIVLRYQGWDRKDDKVVVFVSR